ncbi:MAG: low molecular weight phosphotyrosine protein phosphatase [Bifidobacteriaceae bacterium]|jgi:protein-tyrosine phosphatase|nr:low molecular weight phosphotyrosine protein phosphatase [Bifidobacteriaceae bacterium]MCI1914599.1 low molecular weight phosphotyrosine protein phosphatase [Bifidobacteriaceae bacterium]
MTKPYTVMTVCTGNICRSPMAEVILSAAFAEAGLSSAVSLDSTGVSDEEFGHPIDPRAQKVLRERGYSVPRHSARQITPDEAAQTDLLLPMTAAHKRALMRFVPPSHAAAVRLYRSFDPALRVPSSPYDDSIDLVDPWYGGPQEFNVAIDQIEEVAPFIVDYVREQLRG